MTSAIAGFRAHVEDVAAVLAAVRAVVRETGADVQLMDAGFVATPLQLSSAVHHAARAHEEGRGRSKDLGLEILCYASGCRQIREAVRKAGLRAGCDRIAAVAIGPTPDEALSDLAARLGWRRDDAVLDGGREALRRLGVPDAAMASVPPDRVPELALERVAMMDLVK
ncbi:MAG: KEOPS complex subunit Cgi121 [Methanobacteriota archaeon]